MKPAKMKMRESAEKSLERGLYNEILRKFEKRASLSDGEAVALIGSYAFLGRLDEAMGLWHSRAGGFSKPRKIRCRFYLGVAATRTFRIEEGRALFDANLSELRGSGVSACYIYQGLGFYDYLVGRCAPARVWAEKALGAAFQSSDGYIRFLATDLLGHCTVLLGRRSEGLRLLRHGKELAERHGNRNFAAAFTMTALIYEAELGWRPETIAQELEEALAGLSASDSYTRGSLVLELGRQWTLRGLWKPARDLLDRESASIYAYGNRRQELALQLRLAEIAYRQGDRFAAEHFVRAARRCLHNIADGVFEIRILGMELKLAKAFSSALPAGRRERLLELSEDHASVINRQMMFRMTGRHDPAISETEDPIHHLMRLAQDDAESAACKALDVGYLGLWPNFRGIEPGRSSFVVLKDGRSFVTVSQEGVRFRKMALSLQNLKLLCALKSGEVNKESLITGIWGYRYDPLRHDPLIYSAMTKLRKALGADESWIITTDQGWQLSPEVSWHLPRGSCPERAPVASVLPRGEVSTPSQEGLNFRQLRALERVPEVDVWSVQAYKKAFSVSTMTAFRDLDGLRSLRFLHRTGKGRATRYHAGGALVVPDTVV